MSNTSWVPNEDPQILISERCWLQGALLSSIAYGVTVCLYLLSFHLLSRKENRVDLNKRLPLLIYITVSFILGTLFMISLGAFTQMAFIDDRNYPGGPSAYENNEFSIPIDDMGNAAFVLSNWLSDALVVWRFKVIYQDIRLPMWMLMLFPGLIFTASVAMGIGFLIQISTTNPYVTNNVNFTLPYLSLSLALNIILTIAIVLRLMTIRYRVVSALGKKHGSHYTSIVAMTIESASLYSAISITFLALFGVGSAGSQVFLQSLSQFQTIATFLIVFRIAQGKGWTADTATHVLTAREPEVLELSRKQGGSMTLAATGSGEVPMEGSVEV